MDRTVEEFIHKGSLFSKGYKPDLSRCRFSVSSGGRSFDFHQCNRKAVETVEGHGFCKIHADEVKTNLGIRDDSTAKKYAASFYSREPNLIEMEIYGETDKTIDIQSVKVLMGSSYGLYKGKLKKNSQYTNKYEFFNEFTDAIAWLYEQSESNVQSTLLAYEAAIQVRNKLEAEFLELAPKEEL